MKIRDLHYYVVPDGKGKFVITRSWIIEESHELKTLETDLIYTTEEAAKKDAEVLNKEVQARMDDE